MNIFYLHVDPERAAMAQCDQHVVKMTLETAQMICAIAYDYPIQDVPYKSTHYHHPCTVWAGWSRNHLAWLIRHGEALGKEYTYRYGRTHKSQAVITKVGRAILPYMPDLPWEQPPQAMPDQFKCKSSRLAYICYYQTKARELKRFTYTKRRPPAWLKGVL